jgi:hypothetical protein
MKHKKPDCELIGTDGNVFALAAKVQKVLIENDMAEQASDMVTQLPECENYDESLRLFAKYVNII